MDQDTGVLRKSLLSLRKEPTVSFDPKWILAYKHFLIFFCQSKTSDGSDCVVFDTEKGTTFTFDTGLQFEERSGFTVCYWKDNIFVLYGGDIHKAGVPRGGPYHPSELDRNVHFLNVIENEGKISFKVESFPFTDQLFWNYCHSAHIYQDNMYIFGGHNKAAHHERFLKFDLNEKTWKRCLTAGHQPKSPLEQTTVLFNGKIYLFVSYPNVQSPSHGGILFMNAGGGGGLSAGQGPNAGSPSRSGGLLGNGGGGASSLYGGQGSNTGSPSRSGGLLGSGGLFASGGGGGTGGGLLAGQGPNVGSPSRNGGLLGNGGGGASSLYGGQSPNVESPSRGGGLLGSGGLFGSGGGGGGGGGGLFAGQGPNVESPSRGGGLLGSGGLFGSGGGGGGGGSRLFTAQGSNVVSLFGSGGGGGSGSGLFGGQARRTEESPENTPSLFDLDLETMRWRLIKKSNFLPISGKGGYSSEAIGDKIYIRDTSLDEFFIYNPASDILLKTEDLPPSQNWRIKSFGERLTVFRLYNDKSGSSIEYESFGQPEKQEEQKAISSDPLVASYQQLPHMEYIWKEKPFADITFVVGTEEIQAHRAILLKCRYFQNMFKSGMIEANLNKINVPDISSTNFKAILEYIYLDKIALTEALAMKLIILADMYTLPNLKADCERHLSEKLSVENFVEVMKVAQTADAEKLEKRVSSFLTSNIEKIKQEIDIHIIPPELFIRAIADLKSNKK